nr:MAG TPA: hypothetical protein [Caudoviricetes sp.]
MPLKNKHLKSIQYKLIRVQLVHHITIPSFLAWDFSFYPLFNLNKFFLNKAYIQMKIICID